MDIQVIENFIPSYACQWIINFHQQYFNRFGNIDDNYRHVIDITEVEHELRFDNEFNDSDPLKFLKSRFQNYIYSLDKHAFINYCKIVRWPKNSYQPKHLDFHYHSYTSILYLNNNSNGGELIVDNKTFLPKQGSLISFQGNLLIHEVKKVLEDRYTVSVWYKNFIP